MTPADPKGEPVGDGKTPPGDGPGVHGLRKSREIRYRLEAEIVAAGLLPHDKVPPERELATRFKVHVETIRKALGELVQSGRLYRVERKGTFVSPVVRNKQVLVVTQAPFAPDSWDASFLQFFGGIMEGATGLGESVLPLVMDRDSFLRQCGEIDMVFKDLSGVIFFRDRTALEKSRQVLESKGVPFIFYGSDFHLPALTGVHRHLYDERAIAARLWDHLQAKGYGRVAFMDLAGFDLLAHRRVLFAEEVAARGRPMAPGDFYRAHSFDQIRDGGGETATFQRWLSAMAGPGFALVVAADFMAAGVVNHALRHGLSVPKDFALLGIDNSPGSGQGLVPLTTVEVPTRSDGRRLLEGFLAGGPGGDRCLDLKSDIRMVVRQSG